MGDRIEIFREHIRENGHLVGVAAGSGMTAKYAVMGGCDMLLALSSGRYRSMGLSSMAGFMSYTNSNDLVMEYACREILRAAGSVPVFFGYNATDPSKQMYDYIKLIKQRGFAGVNNYPTIGMIDGEFRRELEYDGISYRQEIDAIHFAHYCKLLTLAFVFNAEQAADMTEAGADMICAHFGLTYGGYLGAKKILTLEHARQTAEEIFAAADRVNPNVIKLVYGGPIKTPLDAQYMYRGSSCQGFIGGSAFERIPVESAILEVTRNFKDNSPMIPKTKLEKIMFSDPGHYNYTDFVKEYGYGVYIYYNFRFRPLRLGACKEQHTHDTCQCHSLNKQQQIRHHFPCCASAHYTRHIHGNELTAHSAYADTLAGHGVDWLQRCPFRHNPVRCLCDRRLHPANGGVPIHHNAHIEYQG